MLGEHGPPQLFDLVADPEETMDLGRNQEAEGA